MGKNSQKELITDIKRKKWTDWQLIRFSNVQKQTKNKMANVQKMNEQQYERTHIQVDKWTTSKWTTGKRSNEQMNK